MRDHEQSRSRCSQRRATAFEPSTEDDSETSSDSSVTDDADLLLRPSATSSEDMEESGGDGEYQDYESVYVGRERSTSLPDQRRAKGSKGGAGGDIPRFASNPKVNKSKTKRTQFK
jgi:hypothetical protein